MRFLTGFCLVFLLGSTWDRGWAAPAVTPPVTAANADAEAVPVDPVVEKWKNETLRLRDSWDKSRLESTLYDKRYKRAYDRWVKAAKAEKAKSLVKRDRAWGEFNLSLERRRLAWYRWEAAKAHQAAAEAESKSKGIAKDIGRVQDRIHKMEKDLGIQPTPTVGISQ